jgi:predicted DNA-binding transcriptional regulator YafY
MQKEIFNRIARIDYLIRIKATGTPSQLAERLGMSERSVYEYINLMKELGAPIKFNSYRQSYYYDTEGSFAISFLPKSDTDAKANRKFGT